MIDIDQKLIYHITHVENLRAIVGDGCLWSDDELLNRQNNRTVIGFDTIKRRRLKEIAVSCHPGTFVGHYVPFYFCPRSPMLFVIHRRNEELDYKGGQDRIVHLVSRIGLAVQAAADQPWAFSDGNAGARYARFCNNLERIDEYVNWSAVDAHYWSDPTVKERKQAEFLVHGAFPWTSIIGIGAKSQPLADEVIALLQNADHKPKVLVKPGWYY